ncbi:hypothetical protein MP228_002398 [Amoeboaphelidium protococcarum]|nr:hypothetical protein MP228_002398 [Amoeboaphelidium protococcarum]
MDLQIIEAKPVRDYGIFNGTHSLEPCYEKLDACEEKCTSQDKFSFDNSCLLTQRDGYYSTNARCLCLDKENGVKPVPQIMPELQSYCYTKTLRYDHGRPTFADCNYMQTDTVKVLSASSSYLQPEDSLVGFVSQGFLSNGTRLEYNVGVQCMNSEQACSDFCQDLGLDWDIGVCRPRYYFLMPDFMGAEYNKVISSCNCVNGASGHLQTIAGHELDPAALLIAMFVIPLVVFIIIMILAGKIRRPQYVSSLKI